MIEVFKPVPNYPDYEVSNLGNVKSLKYNKVRILKQTPSSRGYLMVNLSNGEAKVRTVHQLVAIMFLNHNPNGSDLVINHIDFNKLNNNVENLEVITQRENANRKHLKSSSKYVGVYWNKKNKKWGGKIIIDKKQTHLGFFKDEAKASEAYKNALKKL